MKNSNNKYYTIDELNQAKELIAKEKLHSEYAKLSKDIPDLSKQIESHETLTSSIKDISERVRKYSREVNGKLRLNGRHEAFYDYIDCQLNDKQEINLKEYNISRGKSEDKNFLITLVDQYNKLVDQEENIIKSLAETLLKKTELITLEQDRNFEYDYDVILPSDIYYSARLIQLESRINLIINLILEGLKDNKEDEEIDLFLMHVEQYGKINGNSKHKVKITKN